MLSIAFFNKFLPSDKPNGVSVQVHRLAQALATRGHSVTCFSYSPKPNDALYDHVQFFWKSKSSIGRKFEPALAFSKIDIDKFDIVHYHGDDYLCRGSKKRVRTFYGSALDEAIHAAKPGRFFYQSLFYCFELISCAKRGVLTGISRTTKRAHPSIQHIVPCAVPQQFYNQMIKRSEHPSILFLGDLDSRKRGRMLVDIFRTEILSAIPGCTLTMIGPQECNGEGIRYLGNISESRLIEEYQQAWIYCMVSSYEGFGVPVIESFACGTPVIATVNSGTKEVISHSVNGLLCTPETLGLTIINAIRDKNLLLKLSGNGLFTAKMYTAASIAEQYEKIYKEIVEKNSAKS